MENELKKLTEEFIEEPMEESLVEPLEEPLEELMIEPIKEQVKEKLEGPIEESIEESIEETQTQSVNKYKKIISGITVFLCTLLGIYFAITICFINHFYFGTEINSVNVSCQSLEDAKESMDDTLQNYTLRLKERGSRSEDIKAEEVGLKYYSDEELKKFKQSQNPFKWIFALFDKESIKLNIEVSYDEKLLKERIRRLSCFNKMNIVEPRNPRFQYADHHYVIVDEVQGTKVDQHILYSAVEIAIQNRETEIDLESVNCYIKPQYTSKSQKIIEVKDTLNKYVSTRLTYTFGENKEILEGSIINKWLTVDEEFNINFEEEKIRVYVEELSRKYDTLGKTIKFTTSLGEIVNVYGVDYGWVINNEEETLNIIEDIKAGKAIIKEPIYIQTGVSYGKNGIGNTYVEIDLTKQHLWFYKNGALIVEGDVVTGDVLRNYATPPGVYKLKYKAKNVVLRGPGYAAPVTFWMPFNGGIGIHDATWRGSFGGNIYKTNGSHGCINAPYYVAEDIFNSIEAGIPVVCY